MFAGMERQHFTAYLPYVQSFAPVQKMLPPYHASANVTLRNSQSHPIGGVS